MSLSLRQIEVFRAIMLTQSVTGASELLHVSQPAVSRLLAYIESRVGFVLFERVKGRLYATPEARELYQEVELAYRGVQRINDCINDLVQRRSATLRICCSPSLSQTLLPRALALLSTEHATTRIYLDTLNSADLIEAVLTQEFEMGVSIHSLEHPNLVTVPVYKNRMMVALPTGHPLCDQKVIHAHQLTKERFIGYGNETPLGVLLSTALHQQNITLTPSIVVRHTHTVCALVREGAGVAVVDELTLEIGRWPGIEWRALEPQVQLENCVVYSRSHPLSTTGRELLRLLPIAVGATPTTGEQSKV